MLISAASAKPAAIIKAKAEDSLAEVVGKNAKELPEAQPAAQHPLRDVIENMKEGILGRPEERTDGTRGLDLKSETGKSEPHRPRFPISIRRPNQHMGNTDAFVDNFAVFGKPFEKPFETTGCDNLHRRTTLGDGAEKSRDEVPGLKEVLADIRDIPACTV
ncbi:hypothetical protein LARI1_G008733 [Lachnellula arida]|uniref:Uncharacterized protein n=1 Tax=Lachnellula arida TaxID=1316785 RepID=A0A8T9B0X0_9HELO|nr:hypothetical protein LARI1_G008733 [Lachnellula arida]